ncbi:tRNA(Ile)-lysidine synthetase, partial [Agromyces albus]
MPSDEQPHGRRPRLTPPIADVRRAVRSVLPDAAGLTAAAERSASAPREAPATSAPFVLVALSGGADSLALAAATAFEAPRAGLRAGAVIVDHGL